MPASQQPEKTVSAPVESWQQQAHAAPTHVPPPFPQQPTERDDGSGSGSGRMNWPGVAVIMEAYQRYTQGEQKGSASSTKGLAIGTQLLNELVFFSQLYNL